MDISDRHLLWFPRYGLWNLSTHQTTRMVCKLLKGCLIKKMSGMPQYYAVFNLT